MDDLENCLEVSLIRRKLRGQKDLQEFFEKLLLIVIRTIELKLIIEEEE